MKTIKITKKNDVTTSSNRLRNTFGSQKWRKEHGDVFVNRGIEESEMFNGDRAIRLLSVKSGTGFQFSLGRLEQFCDIAKA